MKTLFLALTLSATLSLSSSVYAQGYVDDLYGKPVKKTVTTKSKTTTSQPSQRSTTTSVSSGTRASVVTPAYQTTQSSEPRSELVTTYEDALERRIAAMRSTQEYPESYWTLQDQWVQMLASKYDQNLYNVIVINDGVWVEPQYITALFDGTDAAAGIVEFSASNSSVARNAVNTVSANRGTTVNINLNLDPWDYGWSSSWLWRSAYWGYRPYWSPYWGGGYWGNYWGGGFWGNHWGGGYYPPYWGGGHNHYYPSHSNRPVYYGRNDRYASAGRGSGAGFGRPASPSARPSSSSARPSSRPSNVVYGGQGYRRGSSGTMERIGSNDAYVNRRPAANPNARPTTPNYNDNRRPAVNSRPATTTGRPEYTRPTQTRRESQTTNPPVRRETTTVERSNSSGSFGGGNTGGGGGGFGGGGGGGGRRR